MRPLEDAVDASCDGPNVHVERVRASEPTRLPADIRETIAPVLIEILLILTLRFEFPVSPFTLHATLS